MAKQKDGVKAVKHFWIIVDNLILPTYKIADSDLPMFSPIFFTRKSATAWKKQNPIKEKCSIKKCQIRLEG